MTLPALQVMSVQFRGTSNSRFNLLMQDADCAILRLTTYDSMRAFYDEIFVNDIQ